MSETPPALDAYMTMWNETDHAAVRGHVEAAFTPDAHFVDPVNEVAGHDAIERMVLGLREQFPDAVYERASGVDGHHDRYRYRWRMRAEAVGALEGADVTQLRDGRICSVVGFFGPQPS